MDQTLFNIAIAIAGTLGGWWLNNMYASMKELERADRALIDRVAAIDVLVAGHYVKRSDLNAAIEALSKGLFATLTRIEDKLDRKADK